MEPSPVHEVYKHRQLKSTYKSATPKHIREFKLWASRLRTGRASQPLGFTLGNIIPEIIDRASWRFLALLHFFWRQIWINWGGVWVEPTQLRVSHLSFSNRSHRSPVCKKGNSNWLIQLIYFCGKTSSVHVFVICNGASSCGPFFSGVLCLVVVPPLWCTIKHPINYSMDEFCKNVHMVKFCGRPNVSSSTAMRLTFVVFREISQQLLDGMPWTLIQTSNNLVYIQIPANYSRSHQLQLLFSAN